MNRLPWVFFGCLLVGPAGVAPAAGPEDAAVRVFATVRYPNPVRPWTSGTPTEVSGTGTVIEGKKVLTNAHVAMYATELYVQGRPGEDKVEARVEVVAADVDLAVLSVKDEKFFRNRTPLPRAKGLPKVQDAVSVYGFPVGGDDLSVTKGVVSRVEAGPFYQNTAGVVIQVSAAVNPGNSGGPAVVDGRLVGVVSGRLQGGENIGYVIPGEEIEHFLDDAKDGRYDGKPADATGAEYQKLDNDALRAFLKVGPDVRGVLVLPPRRPGPDFPFREFDVVSRIGDLDLDRDGMVQPPGGLRVPFYAIIPKLARGGTVPLTVVRQGKPVTVALPVSTNGGRLITDLQGEKLPYFIHGPVVFAAARTDSVALYTRLRPTLYYDNSPLLTRWFDRPRFPGEELVVVASPLFGHKIAKGFSDPVGLVVKEVNRTPVKNLRHLVELLRDAKDEYLTFRFAEDSTGLLVFRREEMAAATADVLEDNGIAPKRRASEDLLAVWKKKAADPDR